MATKGSVRTGTAGWVFEPWRGEFYPAGLVQKKELGYASRHLGAIEINATFRATQKPASFARWAAETPPGFRFSIKGPQLVTHIRRLRNCRPELANFFASGPWPWGSAGALHLAASAQSRLQPRAVRRFSRPPAQGHDGLSRPRGRGGPGQGRALSGRAGRQDDPPRHRDAPPQLCRPRRRRPAPQPQCRAGDCRHRGQSLLGADGRLRLLPPAGPAPRGAKGYEDDDIAALAERLGAWRDAGDDVYAFFVHEDKLHAPRNAMALAAALGATPPADD